MYSERFFIDFKKAAQTDDPIHGQPQPKSALPVVDEQLSNYNFLVWFAVIKQVDIPQTRL